MERLQPSPAEQFALGDARVLRPLRAEVITSAVGQGSPNQLRQRLGQVPPALLALAQRLHGVLALSNVPRQGHEEAVATFPECPPPDFDREDGLVLAPMTGLERDQFAVVKLALDILEDGRSDIRVEVDR